MEETLTPPRAGPRALGSRVSLAAGAWTDIVSITAPAEAAYGQTVNIQVKIKNLASYAIYIAPTAQQDGVNIPMSPEYATVAAGATYTFSGSFSMPNKDIRVTVWSFFWTGEEWWQDDSDYVDIALAEVYAGTISDKALEHDSTYADIPAYDIPQNDRGLVHIWGRNDTSTAQRLGISWTVKNPQGTVVEQYSAWESWPYTGAGKTHEFIGGRFDLDKVGNYTIYVQLLMNYDNPQVVDSYSGLLCQVAAAVPPSEFQGFAIKEYAKY